MTRMSLKMMNSPTSTGEFHNSAWRLKMNRAYYLRVELEALISEYQGNFPTEVIDRDWNGTTLQVELNVRRSPDLAWGTIVGDIIHNYHSALDSLYFALISNFALVKGKTLNKTEKTNISFPIFDDPLLFKEKTREIERYGSQKFQDDLSSYQPFESLNEFVEGEDREIVLAGNLLHILRNLSNTDKHRSLHVIYFFLDSHAIGLPAGVTLESASRPLYFPGQTKYSLSFDFRGATLEEKPSFIPHFKLGVISGTGTPHSSDILHLLRALEGKVGHIIHQLEYHFQPGFGLDLVPETGLQPR